MNIIVPLGGIGSRFTNNGYSTRPKPFVRVLGKPMIFWVLDGLSLEPDDLIVMVYDPKFMHNSMETFMREELLKHYDNVHLVQLPHPTRGAAETVMIGLQGLSKERRGRPTMLLDGDTCYTCDIVSMFRKHSGYSAVFVFHDTQPKPIYSYCKFDTVQGGNGEKLNLIREIREKVKISDYANSGCYCFSDDLELERYCYKVIEQGITQLSQDQKGEFYTSGVIAAMLKDNVSQFVAIELNASEDIHVLGTPEQVESFCKDPPAKILPLIRKCRFVFDIDSTLMTEPMVKGDYTTCKPIDRNVEYLRQLYAAGHHIILNTARRMRTHNANVSAVIADIGELTLRQLREMDIPYDEIAFGKPWGQFYIDDLAIDPLGSGGLAKQIGFYFPLAKQLPIATKRSAPVKESSGPSIPPKSNSSSTSQSTPKQTSTAIWFGNGLLMGLAIGTIIGLLLAKNNGGKSL